MFELIFDKLKEVIHAVSEMEKKDKLDVYDVKEVSKSCKKSDIKGLSEMYRPLFEILLNLDHREEEKMHGFTEADIMNHKGGESHHGQLMSHLSRKIRVKNNEGVGSSLKHEIK